MLHNKETVNEKESNKMSAVSQTLNTIDESVNEIHFKWRRALIFQDITYTQQAGI